MALAGADAHAGSVFGTVTDNPSFLPIEGAWVYLAGKRPATDSTRTDSTGAFRFSEVADCGTDCQVLVRMPGYWLFESPSFSLAPDQNLLLDIQLDLIHSLTVRVVKAEDTGQSLLTAHAVLTAAEFDIPRCLAVDSAGKSDFKDLHSFTAYLLTVSAPGRKAATHNLHFHDPPARGFWRQPLEIDSAQSGKSLRGALSAKDGGPFPGARALLSCRSGQVAADLFAEAGRDGIYAIEGMPAECDSAMLYAGTDSVALALTDKDTRLDWVIGVQRTSALRPARAPGRRMQPAWRADRKCAYDLAGRKSAPRAHK